MFLDNSSVRTSPSKDTSSTLISPFGSTSLYSFLISAILSSISLIALSLFSTETTALAADGMAFLLTPPEIVAI